MQIVTEYPEISWGYGTRRPSDTSFIYTAGVGLQAQPSGFHVYGHDAGARIVFEPQFEPVVDPHFVWWFRLGQVFHHVAEVMNHGTDVLWGSLTTPAEITNSIDSVIRVGRNVGPAHRWKHAFGRAAAA